jgi:DNA-binding CsgD family transcriptional regulator
VLCLGGRKSGDRARHSPSDLDAGRLPSAVHAVAGRALRTAESSDDPGEVTLARVLSRSGTWIVLHGTSLVASGSRRAAVIVEPAHPARITPLLMSAYGLTEREQAVTRLVLRGHSTAQIAERLVVSPHTVQEHLNGVFEKTGVHSRRELVGKVFFAHHEPRFRDNENRALEGDPLRGEPSPTSPTSPTTAAREDRRRFAKVRARRSPRTRSARLGAQRASSARRAAAVRQRTETALASPSA